MLSLLVIPKDNAPSWCQLEHLFWKKCLLL